jgi:hypothetical protein
MRQHSWEIPRSARARRSLAIRWRTTGLPSPREHPHVAKPEEDKGRCQPRISNVMCDRGLASEVDHAGFVGVNLQPELPQPFPKYPADAFGVVFVRQTASQSRRSSAPECSAPADAVYTTRLNRSSST